MWLWARRVLRCGAATLLSGYVLAATWTSIAVPAGPFCRPRPVTTAGAAPIACVHDRPMVGLVLLAAGLAVMLFVGIAVWGVRRLAEAGVIVVWIR